MLTSNYKYSLRFYFVFSILNIVAIIVVTGNYETELAKLRAENQELSIDYNLCKNILEYNYENPYRSIDDLTSVLCTKPGLVGGTSCPSDTYSF